MSRPRSLSELICQRCGAEGHVDGKLVLEASSSAKIEALIDLIGGRKMKPVTMATTGAVIAAAVGTAFVSVSYADTSKWGPSTTVLGELSASSSGTYAHEIAVLTAKGLSLTRANEALVLQGEVDKAGLPGEVEAALGKEFAGVWFEPARAQFHIGVTSHISRRAVRHIVATTGLTNVVETPVRSTRSALVASQDSWNTRLAKLLVSDDATTGLDFPRNAVSITLSSAVPLRERMALEYEAAMASVNIVLKVVPSSQLRIQPIASCEPERILGAYCKPTIVSGVTIEPERRGPCTAGPMLIEGNETYMLTAGHCFGERGQGNINEKVTSKYELGSTPLEIGSSGKWFELPQIDIAEVKVKINNPLTFTQAFPDPVPAVMAEWGKKSETPQGVIGAFENIAGQVNCHEGEAMGEQCGVIGTVDVAYMTKEHLVEDSACAEAGDSGGPFFYSNSKVNNVHMQGVAVLVNRDKECPGIPSAHEPTYYESLQDLPEARGTGILSTFPRQSLLTTANEVRGNRPEILDEGHNPAAGVTVSGTSKNTTELSILGSSITIRCSEVAIEGEQEGSSVLGSFHFHWQKCTTSAGGTCTGLGDASGSVLALGAFHLVTDKLLTEGALGLGILFLVEHVHFTCTVLFVTKLLLVSGEILCLLTPLTLTSKVTVKCETSGTRGDPGQRVYWNERGERVEMSESSLVTAENEGTGAMSAESGEFEATTNIRIELMD